MGLLEKLQERNQKNQDALRAIIGKSCNLESPTKKWRCMLPKDHIGEHTTVIKVVWLKNKEEYRNP